MSEREEEATAGVEGSGSGHGGGGGWVPGRPAIAGVSSLEVWEEGESGGGGHASVSRSPVKLGMPSRIWGFFHKNNLPFLKKYVHGL